MSGSAHATAAPGPIGRWIRRDPVRAVAVALILVQLAWRAEIATRGWFSQDEFYIAEHATESKLDANYLFGLFNNHLMPAGMLIAWLVTRAVGYAFWPYAVLLTLGQAVLDVAFFRLLRDLLRPSWWQLLPLSLFLFCPLMLETTSLWVVGLLMLPVLLSMVWALGAQVKYVRTGRRKHLLTLAAALLFGLLFSEKAALTAPLLFLFTACLFVQGGLVRTVVRTLTAYWRAWVVIGGVSLAYAAGYVRLSQDAIVPKPKSVAEVLTFLGDLVGTTLVPGLFGGPWRWWYAGDGPPLADPYDVAMWLSWAALLALIIVTTVRRPAAGRAWVLLVAYFVLVAGLLAGSRLGNVLSPLAGMVPRYVSDVAVVAALVIGVVLVGLRSADPSRLRWPSGPGFVAAGVAVAVVLGIGTIWSTARFRDAWDVKHGRDYLRTTQAELAQAPAGTVFLDASVPNLVIEGYWYPYNQQSRFFLPAEHKPVFVTEAEHPSVFDEAGHIRPATVVGTGIPKGPVNDCGHLIGSARPTAIPLEHAVVDWDWVVYFGYLSSGDSTATVRLGGGTRQITVHRGLNQLFFTLHGGGDAVEVTVSDPTVVVCTDKITVGAPAPAAP